METPEESGILKINKGELEGLLIIEPDVYEDERGFFMESWNKRKYEEAGIDCEFVQDNHSSSVRGVIRGLHFQTHPGQAKLVRCTRGKIWDVAVDLREGSKTYKKWFGVELSEHNKKQFFIPVGFAHGFAALDEVNDVQYKCSSFYDPETESGIAWEDPEIGIDWPIEDPLISQRDYEYSECDL